MSSSFSSSDSREAETPAVSTSIWPSFPAFPAFRRRVTQLYDPSRAATSPRTSIKPPSVSLKRKDGHPVSSSATSAATTTNPPLSTNSAKPSPSKRRRDSSPSPTRKKAKYDIEVHDTDTQALVNRLLKENDVAAGAEALAIQELLKANSSVLKTLNADIKELIRIRDERQVMDGKCRAALSPVRTLPTELISHIFKFVSKGNPIRLFHTEEPSSFVVSRVCRRWRSIALSTTSLWDSITIEYASEFKGKYQIRPAGSPMPAKIDTLDLVLKRGAGCPLRFYFSVHLAHEAKALMATLMQHSRRWSNIVIDGATMLGNTLDGVKGKLPLLQALRLEPDSRRFATKAFADAPRLTNVALIDVTCDQIDLPWSQLRRITITQPDPWDVYDIICGTPKLRELVVLHEPPIVPPPHRDNLAPVRLEHLERLELALTHLHHILPHLIAPKLKELYLGPDEGTSKLDHIIKFICRSKCKLNSFQLVGMVPPVAASARSIGEVIALCPDLHTFVVDTPEPDSPVQYYTDTEDEPGFVRALVGHMRIRKDGTNPLPKLKRFVLRATFHKAFSAGAQKALIEAVKERSDLRRVAGRGGLASFEYGFGKKLDERRLLQLDAMKFNGLKVTYSPAEVDAATTVLRR